MKILVCGSRDFEDYPLLKKVINDLMFGRDGYLKLDTIEGLTIISGGAKGADLLVEKYIKEGDFFPSDKSRIFNEIHLPDWDKYGKRAGMIRNQKMIDEKPNLVIAFWDGVSRGTENTISLAKKNKIQTLIVYF